MELMVQDAKIEPRNLGISINFDSNSLEGKKRLFNAFNSPESLNGSGKTRLTLDGISVREIYTPDEATGEVVTDYETVFICQDGKNYFSRSFGIGKSAINLMAACGGVIPEGITVEINEVKLDQKRTMKQLAWV